MYNTALFLFCKDTNNFEYNPQIQCKFGDFTPQFYTKFGDLTTLDYHLQYTETTKPILQLAGPRLPGASYGQDELHVVSWDEGRVSSRA